MFYKLLKKYILNKGVRILTSHSLTAIEENGLHFVNKSESIKVSADHYIFSMGGASWKKTGSDGHWTKLFNNIGLQTIPFMASNCGWEVSWPLNSIEDLEGKPLKNIACRAGDQYCKGEVMITSYGLEGSALYSVQGALRSQYMKDGEASLFIDAKPQWTQNQVFDKLSLRGSRNRTSYLKDHLKLPREIILLLKAFVSKEDFLNDLKLSIAIKNIPIKLLKNRSIDESISTIGGIGVGLLDDNFQLLELPDHYCIGEMIDWDAPTGGYLLQACFSMGFYLANKLNIK